MSIARLTHAHAPSHKGIVWTAVVVVALGVAAAGGYAVLRWAGWLPALGGDPSGDGAARRGRPAETGDPAVVPFAEEKWAAAGLRVEPARKAPLTERVWRTGKLALNDERVAHVAPLVEGVVREVRVRLGQDVAAGAVLAVLDSKEIGQAKLDLARARLALTFAQAQHDWTSTVSKNTQELLDALGKDAAVGAVEARFKGRPIGERRQQLMTAYVKRLQLKSAYEGVKDGQTSGAVGVARYREAKAEYETAEATFQAVREDIDFHNRQEARAAAQKLKEAEAAVTLVTTQLLMTGFSRAEVEAMDPAAEGAKVALYPIRAPFAGTVISRHATISERAGPQTTLFEVADLARVYVEADVPEADLEMVRGLAGGKLTFRTGGADGRTHQADVLYAGDVVDSKTRAVTLVAVAANADRRLKPGQYIDVQLTRGDQAPVVQVPSGAVQRQGEQAYVFVHEGGDTFRKVDVTLGRSAGDMVEITAGLEPGTPVVVRGGFALKSEMLRSLMQAD